MKTALITGGLGFIGSFVARELLGQGAVERVVCLDHFGRYTSSHRPDFVDHRKLRLQGIEDRVVIERGEARYYGVLQRLLERHRPALVFHLAALPLAKLDNLNVEEAREGSVDSTGSLLEILGHLHERDGYRPERFLYASSSMVYGDFTSEAVDEDALTQPREIYGTMKLAGERVTEGLGRYYDIPWTIVRPSAVYGPTDMNRRVTQIFLEKAFLGEELSIAGADERLDFTYVKDAAAGFVLAATSPAGAGETFNVTYGKAHRLLDFVEALRVHFPDLRFRVVERDAFRPRRGTLGIAKARRLLGYEPRYSLQEGVAEYVDFVKRHSVAPPS